jgi:hypothetical protein
LPQASTPNQPPTQNLSSITEGPEHAAFGDIPEVELPHATNNNASTAVVGSSQHIAGSSTTKTNGEAPHQLPPRVPLPIQVIQEHVELEQLQVKDWEDKASEDKAEEEAELARVQQEIKRLHQEIEAITRRQAAAQRAEVRRHHINRERAKTRGAPIHHRDPSPIGTEVRASVRATEPPKQPPPTATTSTAYANPTPPISPPPIYEIHQ